jgi:hypothetical protein
MQKTIDITPSPRVLRMLGQIDFQPWQCLAELIDNSIDAFLDQIHDGAILASPRVAIDLPTDTDLVNGSAELVITDNGRGMTLEQLQQAVRAGYSGNDPVEKMGLFGMGFNISTARLGRRTEVWTTTAELPEWIGIVIDFDQLERAQSFSTEVMSREKSDFELETKSHGTTVHIKKLEPDRIRPLIWGAGKARTRKRLGKIYGRVMAAMGVSIIYGGEGIKPWRHCTWDTKRSVPTKDHGNVPARIEIDEELDPRKYCTTCWIWLNSEDTKCPSCGLDTHLIERQRRLKGWIGVQRYFDKEHYGFDLIRNGRVIEDLDKSLFYFETDQGDSLLEYPLDATHWGGRIVGELEIDFVRVSHQKDSFDKLDPEWKHVVELVRGNSPLRPQIANRMGLPQNTSPLARLYAGYRSGHVGLGELVPGDANGIGMNGGIIREWVDRFYAGEEEYQSDEKWYGLVLQGEKAKRGNSSGGEIAGGEPPIMGITTDVKGSSESFTGEEETPEPPTEPEPPVEEFEDDDSLSRTYELNIDQTPISIIVQARKNMNQTMEKPYNLMTTGFLFQFDFNPRNSFFEDSLDTPLDCLLDDLSQHFLALSTRSPRDWPVSIIERELREKYFPETLTNIAQTADQALALIAELREHLDEKLPSVAPIDLAMINAETLEKIQLRALQNDLGDQDFVNEVIKKGRFVKYVDNKFLIRLINLWPELVMDGTFFSNPYATLTPSLKEEALRMLINGMEDICWLAGEGRDAMSKDTAWRLRYGRALASMRLVISWRS